MLDARELPHNELSRYLEKYMADAIQVGDRDGRATVWEMWGRCWKPADSIQVGGRGGQGLPCRCEGAVGQGSCCTTSCCSAWKSAWQTQTRRVVWEVWGRYWEVASKPASRYLGNHTADAIQTGHGWGGWDTRGGRGCWRGGGGCRLEWGMHCKDAAGSARRFCQALVLPPAERAWSLTPATCAPLIQVSHRLTCAPPHADAL